MMDVAVIGAGVVGALIARELSRYQLDVCMLEKADDVAMGTSKANSAIVHAGFDCQPGSVMAKMNVRGNAMMDQLTRELSVPFKRNGSMVLAFGEEDAGTLQILLDRGIQNGVPGVEIVSGDRARELEPNISGNVTAALVAPSGGIVCPYELTIAAAGNAMDNGVRLYTGFEVISADFADGVWTLVSAAGDQVQARYVINAAGLFSDRVAVLLGDTEYHLFSRRGEYLLLDRDQGQMVSHTIFQCPSAMGKGILVTPTVDGNLLLGPTSENREDREDTATTAEGLATVARLAAKSVPSVNLRAVITSFTGLRSCSPGHDFVIESSKNRPQLVEITGIESPGLSSAPAIAEYAVGLLKEMGLPLHEKADFNPIRRPIPRFREMDIEQRRALIQEDARFGQIICRCETVTEGEIVRALHQNPPAHDLDGVKRRTRTGMGRCNGGFCTPQAVEIIARELGIPVEQVTKCGGDSRLLVGKTKEGGQDA
ncbi:MAG TPA: NAD(P)/FAD-dependent oxidoreductase [Candidatus Faecivivens stercorigallinarum]|nr:NAD(P)/FAD-dependent oxidoreductase [Candidatus Faecivivens stercorigallinarum]